MNQWESLKKMYVLLITLEEAIVMPIHLAMKWLTKICTPTQTADSIKDNNMKPDGDVHL